MSRNAGRVNIDKTNVYPIIEELYVLVPRMDFVSTQYRNDIRKYLNEGICDDVKTQTMPPLKPTVKAHTSPILISRRLVSATSATKSGDPERKKFDDIPPTFPICYINELIITARNLGKCKIKVSENETRHWRRYLFPHYFRLYFRHFHKKLNKNKTIIEASVLNYSTMNNHQGITGKVDVNDSYYLNENKIMNTLNQTTMTTFPTTTKTTSASAINNNNNDCVSNKNNYYYYCNETNRHPEEKKSLKHRRH
ncbi:hypothetical protein SNEBB_007170 [Seison nebaliae]|nr:hypothetical protein SNEBB_007170 [Seison nebaliae]